jgi:Amt family ammonium transporter
MLTTQVATAVALMTWIFWEKATGHAMSAVGAATGAVVGLVAITPAAGIVSPAYAMVIGVLGATASFWAVQSKHFFKVDDVLDVFACHGVAGIVGAILTGAFAFSTGSGKENVFEQVQIQTVGVVATIVYAAVGTFIIIKLIDLVMGIRLAKDDELQGVDIINHEESAYTNK